MPEIILTTLNAKFIHTAFGLRYLLANMGALQPRTRILEFDINQRPLDIAESLLAANPRIVGLGVYIWNAAQSTEVVRVLKRLRPEVIVILGGPEVSYEPEDQAIIAEADYVVSGEADLAFPDLCADLLAGLTPGQKFIKARLPTFSELALPYDFYSDHDLAHRIVYVEASRGCPFSCEFCLSSLDIPVRQSPLPEFIAALDKLLSRGAGHFKFVDRTFNLNLQASREILQFCLHRYQPGRFFHFEMVPDRLPDELRELVVKFPPGALQFEVGVQTFNSAAASMISRRQNYLRLEENLQFLRQQTGVHVHADLIAGLPGEDLRSFGEGFDRLIGLEPHEIQVGILKRLRGTPITRHTEQWKMVYNPHPPYELLQNALIGFADMQKLRRFARYWDLVGNSGNFLETTPLLWRDASPFASFMRLSEWLHSRTGRTDSIALLRLMELLFQYLCGEMKQDARDIANALYRDYQRGGRFDKPGFLKDYLPVPGTTPAKPDRKTGLKRQARHHPTLLQS